MINLLRVHSIGKDHQAAERYIDDYVLMLHDMNIEPEDCVIAWVDKQATLDNPDCPEVVKGILKSDSRDFYTLPGRVNDLGVRVTTRLKKKHSRP